jgi:clan AA aspartic protease (TIGR02281 family)
MTPPNAPLDDLAAFFHERGFASVPLAANAVGHFEIAAEVNGHAARLLLDTGASRTVLATVSAERFGLEMTQSAKKARGVGESEHDTATATVAELRLGEARLDDVAVSTLDFGHLNQGLAARGGNPIDGVIGGDLLRPAEAIIDCARARLFLRESAAAR